MPKIGLRIWKSALAVFFCFLINDLRRDGIVFYSIIAAILCMQPSLDNSFETAKQRMIGTLLGGLSGMVYLSLQNAFLTGLPTVVIQLVLSLCVVPLIYVTVQFKCKSSSYITCVVFMSIVVSHGADLNPFLFGMNRMLDTVVGIVVSLAVNAFIAPAKKLKLENK